MSRLSEFEAVTTGAHNVRQRRVKPRRGVGVTTLMYAAQQGNVDRVRKIIRVQQSSSLFDRDRTGKSALHYCSTSDSISASQAADLLVMAAPDLVNGRDVDGFTPLHLAVIAGNLQLVTFLLANNADVNAMDNEKHTVVHWATVCGETAALRAVLAAGAPVSTPDVHGGYPLHYAAQMCGGDRESNLGLQVLQTLLSHTDIVVSVTDGDKRQPLLWAASAGSARAVLALVRAGGAVEGADKDGLTALHCAASRGHTDCMDTLLTLCGASPDVIDSNGCTALHYAVTLGYADATALLLAHGADPNRQDRKGRSPAHCGCAKGQFETVKLIGSRGANLWLRNARGDLPLHDAAASGRRDLVKWLLEMRPSHVNSRNNDGRCPLHMAALNDNVDMCKILLDAGAQINPVLRTSKNLFMTPMDCALQRGFRSTAKYLQLHGGVPAARIGDQRTQPIDSAMHPATRDDITVRDDTSTDSERENGEVNKIGRRTYRRKIAQKYERKRASLSGSDIEALKTKSEKLYNDKNKISDKEPRDKRPDSEIIKSATSARKSGVKKPSPSRLSYNNEIIINGRTEININQHKEIIIEKDNKMTQDQADPVPTRVSARSGERGRRPRSAKYSRLRERSAKSRMEIVTSPETVIRQENLKKEADLTKQSTNTSEETPETVIENKMATSMTLDEQDTFISDTLSEEKKINLSNTKLLQDQYSVISNTSEDIDEQQKNLVVEASVHAPPKSVEEDYNNQKGVGEIELVQEKIESNVGATEENQEENVVNDKEENVIKEIEEETADNKDSVTEYINQHDENAINEDAEKPETRSLEESADILVEDKTTIGLLELNVNELDQEIKPINDIEAMTTEKEKVSLDTDASDLKKEIDQGALSSDNNVIIQKLSEDKKSLDDSLENKNDNGTKVNDDMHIKSEYQDRSNKTSSILILTNENENTETQALVVNEEPIETIDEKEPIPVGDQDENDINRVRNADKSDIKEPGDSNLKIGVETDQENTRIEVAFQKIKGNGLNEMEREGIEKNGSVKIGNEQDSTIHENNILKRIEKKVGEVSYEEYSSNSEESLVSPSIPKSHKSFRILDEAEATKLEKPKPKRARIKRSPAKESRSRSDENKQGVKDKTRRSKIPMPSFKSNVSKSDKHLDRVQKDNTEEQARVPSLPNIHDAKHLNKDSPRCESNMSAPLLASLHSDNEEGSVSDTEVSRRLPRHRRRVKKKTRTREARSAGSDYESSNLIDSGFEPSPRNTIIPRWKNMSERGVNMTSVTQTIQNNIRRYHLERKIFHQLLELKRHQIRAGQHNEAILVKRAIDDYHKSCASTVGAGRYIPKDYTFKSFEKFLYEALRKLQKNDADYMKDLPANANPLLCTKSTNRCMHATHAYTGVPCAAYLPKMDHHSIPKIGFNNVNCKPGTGFLPNINSKKPVTLELSHGNDKQIISLPTDRLDQNKRYYVTFTVKGHASPPSDEENVNKSNVLGHRHSKSD